MANENNPKQKTKFVDRIWETHLEEKRIVRYFKSLFQTIWASTARFKEYEDLMRAESIAFQVVVSIIPLLVLTLIIFDSIGVDFKMYEALAKEFTRKNDLSLDITVYFNLLYSLVDKKGALSGIGALILILSATSILRKMEEAMNRIWAVKRPRPFMIRMTFFVFIIIMSPFLIGIGISLGQNLLDHFASPALKTVRLFKDKAIVTGEKHVLMERTRQDDWKYLSIMDKIDFESQKSPIVFDGKTNKHLLAEELLPYKDRIRPAGRNSLSKATFMDIEHFNQKYWILTNEGSLIYSEDDKETWKIRHFQRVEGNVLIPARFRKILFLNEMQGVIIGDRGLILKTNDGGLNWNPSFVNGIDKEDLNSISKIEENKLLIVGQHFTALISEDNGDTWSKYSNIESASSIGIKENLNSITKKGDSIYICGDQGTIIYSKDQGNTWNRKDIGMKNIDFHDLLFLNEQYGIVIGDDGNIRYTKDGGYNWKKAKSHTQTDLWSAVFDPIENKIIITGSNYRLLTNTKGIEDLSDFKVIKKTPLWRLLISFVGNFLLPFSLIWIVLFLLNKGLPNTNVETKPAVIGSIVTSVLWVLFIMGFKYYAFYFLNLKIAIYGALAAIPLLFLLINLSIIIVLFGSEIAYLIQNPAMKYVTYKQRILHRIEQHQVWWGFSILRRVFENFYSGKGQTPEKELLKICHHDENEFLKLVDTLEKNGWIGKYTFNTWTPIVSADNIKILDIVNSVSPTGYDIEDYNPKDLFKVKLLNLFDDLEKSKSSILADLRLNEVLYIKQDYS